MQDGKCKNPAGSTFFIVHFSFRVPFFITLLEGERLPVKTPVQALVLLTVYLVLDAADEPRPLRIPSIRLRFVSSPTIARAFW